MIADEWGPWIPWGGGLSCPVAKGFFIQVEECHRGERRRVGIRVDDGVFQSPAWRRSHPFGDAAMIVRYRVRAPRGMAALRRLLKIEIGYAQAPNRRPTR